MLRRLPVLITCALAALVAWIFLPGSTVDRAAFHLTARSFANPPFFNSGEGTVGNPHALGLLKSSPGRAPATPPTVVSLGDDRDGFFQTSPPSPVDFAIILKNFKRLGIGGPALAIPLAWQEAEVISLAALDLQLDALPDAITSAPLTRKAVPSALPPAFRRAATPISEIEGNISLLPIVNHVAIPDVILGTKNALAGFSFLESEAESEKPYLLARWDDSVVPSFALLAAVNHFRESPSSLRIHLGEYIAFSETGPFIPIDSRGRLAFVPQPVDVKKPIPAANLINAPDDLFAAGTNRPVILRNDISSSDFSTRRFSESLVDTVTSLTDPSFAAAGQTFPRLNRTVELCLLGSMVFILAAFSGHPLARHPVTHLVLFFTLAALHFSLVPLTGIWLPSLPAAAALLGFALVSSFSPRPGELSAGPAPEMTPAIDQGISEPRTALEKPDYKGRKKGNEESHCKKNCEEGG